MVEEREWRWAARIGLAVVLVSWLPYIVGWAAAPPSGRFAGLVYNPLDGHTYIAKMRLGLEGSWLLRLTYTPEPQEGAPIYLFYLLLGHLARWTGLPLLAVYHGARTAGGLALLFGLYRLAAYLTDEVRKRRLLFLLAALGAGLGWLAAPLGRETPDLWVAEAFPFVALLTNAHFPTALALMVWASLWGLEAGRRRVAGVGFVSGTVVLGALQPFGLPPLFGGLAGMMAVRTMRRRAIPWRSLGWAALAALCSFPYPLYVLHVLGGDPVFSSWQTQNVTPSPSLCNWLLAFGLMGPLALVGAVYAARRRRGADGLLVGWMLATAVGLSLPLNLARRLSLGLGIGVGLLAGLGWGWLARRLRGRVSGLLAGVVVGVSLMTPLFLLLLGAGATLAEHPLLYLSDGEWSALTWLRDHAPHDAVVLCAPETGLFVPAWAGQRVVYGHPTETVNADMRRRQVERFWAGERDGTWLAALGVDYFFYGPREQALGDPPAGELLFETGDTAIYRR